MRRVLLLVLLSVLASVLVAQQKPAPIRICVAALENNSRHMVNPTWQRDQLVKALERTNKSKEVKKGKAPQIEAVALQTAGEPDAAVREKNCAFVLHTTLTEVMRAGRPSLGYPPPGAVQVGTGIGDARGYPSDDHTATANYELLRAGNFKAWSAGMVSADDQLAEEALVSQLMDQVARRVVSDLRKPHPIAPE